MRRIPWLGLVLGTFCLSTTGCEHHRSLLRPNDEEKVKAVESDTSKIPAVDSDPKDPQPFFKNSRLSSGLSPEARDIEKNLGIGS
jgi:hypothetical protein